MGCHVMAAIEPPPKAPAEFRYTVRVVAVLMAAAALHQVYIAMGGRLVNACVAAILIAGVVGIMRSLRWGRRIAVVFLWGSIIIAFGLLSPFRAGDLLAEGIEPPSLTVLALQFAVISTIALGCLHFLGKHKRRFRPAWI